MTDTGGRRVALLRAVNVGGTGKLRMADLRAMTVALGYSDATTLLQSGNLVFGGADRTDADLETRFEVALTERFGLRSDVMIRSPEAWDTIIDANPFPGEASDDPRFVHVVALKTEPHPSALADLRGAIAGNERIELLGRELYIHYADGSGNSKLTNVIIEKKLRTRGTARNWNTVLKIKTALAQGH